MRGQGGEIERVERKKEKAEKERKNRDQRAGEEEGPSDILRDRMFLEPLSMNV